MLTTSQIEFRTSKAEWRIQGTAAVEVGDGEPRLPDGPDKPTDSDVGGRGLMILDRLADRWGSHPRRTAPGKVVWFEVRHPLAA